MTDRAHAVGIEVAVGAIQYTADVFAIEADRVRVVAVARGFDRV